MSPPLRSSSSTNRVALRPIFSLLRFHPPLIPLPLFLYFPPAPRFSSGYTRPCSSFPSRSSRPLRSASETLWLPTSWRKDEGGATKSVHGPPLFHGGCFVVRGLSLECGFLHVFVSEARNSVCPLALRLEPGHGSSSPRSPMGNPLGRLVAPLAEARGAISYTPVAHACTEPCFKLAHTNPQRQRAFHSSPRIAARLRGAQAHLQRVDTLSRRSTRE